MRRGSWTLLTTLLFATVAAPAVFAQADCDALIVDEARVLQEPGQIEAAAAPLAELGALVRVRTLRNADNDLEAVMERTQERCASWRAPDGGRRNNLLVLYLSIEDRGMGTYYGSQWEGLDAQYLRIQSEHMGPRFRDGDFSGGIAAGMREIARVLEARLRPPVDAPGGAPFRPEPFEPQFEAEDSGSSTTPAAIFLLVLVLGGLGALGLYQLLRRREIQEQAQAHVTEAKDAASAAFLALDELRTTTRERVEVSTALVGKQDATALRELHERAEPLAEQAVAAYLQASEAYEAERSAKPERLHEIAAGFEAVVPSLTEATGAVQAAAALAGRLQTLSDELPVAVPAAAESVTAARALEQATREDGYLTREATDKIDRAEKTFARAATQLRQMDLTESKELLDRGHDDLERVVAYLRGLPAARTELSALHDELTTRSRAMPATIATAHEAFDRIAAEFAESSWDDVAGNGTESEKRLDAATSRLEAAQEMLSMERQEWDAARTALADVDGWLDETDRLLGAIHDREAAIRAAQRDARAEIDAADADITAARAFVKAHAADVSPDHARNIDRASEHLRKARKELEKQTPDFLIVVAKAQEANTAADAVLAQARSEHEHMERLRRRAASAERDAQAAIARAKQFADSHSRDVGTAARAALARSVREWSDVSSASSLEERIAEAEETRALAEQAYTMARSDFDAAEDRRREERRRRQAASSSWGSSSGGSSSFSSSSSSSGGGSSSFGSSGGGGGGSSRW